MEKPAQEPSDEPKQVTPKGLEIAVPKRRDLMDAFRKITRPAKKPSTGVLLMALREEVIEHRRDGIAAVVAPHPLVQVALEPLGRDRVMRSAHAGLEQAEEALHGLCVNIAFDVDPVAVADAPVPVRLPDRQVAGVLVCEQHRAGDDETPAPSRPG